MTSPIIEEKDDAKLYRQIEDGNLLAQYDVLENTVLMALREKEPFRISHTPILRFHQYGTMYLCRTPGAYRTTEPVGILNSTHKPPCAAKVQGLMDDFVAYLNENWEKKEALYLAAYALWGICAIHPFTEGNGRTARAMCCYVLCMRLGFWIPGPLTIPKQIRANRSPYYEALQQGDQSDPRTDYYNLGAMEKYLSGLLAAQLQSS